MTGVEVDDRAAFDRAVADPALLARFAALYDGPLAPLDALWWLDHPDEPTPGGTPSPTVRLAELRRALYSRGGDPSVADDYAAASARWASDRAATVRALEAATVPPVADPLDDDAIAMAEVAGPTDARRRVRRRAIIAGAATTIGVAALLIAGAVTAPGLSPRPGAAASASDTPTRGTYGSYSIRFKDGSGGSALPTTPPAPAVDGTVLATVTNATSGPSTRDLDGGNERVSFALRCAGVGEVYVALSDHTSLSFVCEGVATETVMKRSLHPLHTFSYVITTGGSALWSMRIYRAA